MPWGFHPGTGTVYLFIYLGTFVKIVLGTPDDLIWRDTNDYLGRQDLDTVMGEICRKTRFRAQSYM